jgi:hypothetical protein
MNTYLQKARDRIEIVQKFAAVDEHGQVSNLEVCQHWHAFIYLGENHEVAGLKEIRTDHGDLVTRESQGRYLIYRNGHERSEIAISATDGP